jgi:hypothetical protein
MIRSPTEMHHECIWKLGLDGFHFGAAALISRLQKG